jgi:hypothetical protein
LFIVQGNSCVLNYAAINTSVFELINEKTVAILASI